LQAVENASAGLFFPDSKGDAMAEKGSGYFSVNRGKSAKQLLFTCQQGRNQRTKSWAPNRSPEIINLPEGWKGFPLSWHHFPTPRLQSRHYCERAAQRPSQRRTGMVCQAKFGGSKCKL